MKSVHLWHKVNDPKVIVILLFLVNFFLKFIFLGSRDIAMDEPFTIFWAQADLPTLFGMLKNENNPPLFFLLLHFWTKIFGISALSVRFLPMLFSAGTACLLFLTGSRYFSKRVGILASLIFTFSNYHQLFSHEARVYSIFSFLAVLSMYSFLGLIREKRTNTVILLFIANLLLVYSHFFGFIVLFIQFFSSLVFPTIRKKIFIKYLLLSFLVLLMYTPYLYILIPRFLTASSGGTWVLKPLISDLYTMIWRFSNAPVVAVTFIVILAGGLILWIREFRKGEAKEPVMGLVVATWFFLPYLSMFLISFILPIFLDRYLVFVSSGFYLLLSLTADSLFKRKVVFGLAAFIMITLMVATFHPDIDNKRRVGELVQAVRGKKEPGTVVLICPSWLEYGFTYHYNLEYFRDYREIRNRLILEKIYPINGLNEIDTIALRQATNILYIEEWATLVDKTEDILRYLSKHYPEPVTYHFFESFSLHEFRRKEGER